FLVFTCIIFMGLIFYYFYQSTTEESRLKLVFAWALVCGTGAATKFNFIPLLIIPLFLIKGISRKILFGIFTVAAFILFTLPVISKYKYMFAWVYRIFSSSGLYGSGDQTVMSIPDFLNNVKTILSDNMLFLTAYLSSFVLTVYSLYMKFISKKLFSDGQKKSIRLLSGIFIAATFQIFIVAKHYKSYYMLPSLMLTMVTLFLSASLINSIIQKSYFIKAAKKIIFPLLIVFIIVKNIFQFNTIHNQYNDFKLEALKVNQSLKENYGNDFVIPTFATSNSNYGLALGMVYSGARKEEYKKILANKLSYLLFYDPWQKKLFSYEPGKERNDYFDGKKSMIFHTSGRVYDKSAVKEFDVSDPDNENVNNFSALLLTKYGVKINSVTKLESFKNGDILYRLNF
ncbi:MAG: hypothetical protein ABI840_11080, partial [bacterium]